MSLSPAMSKSAIEHLSAIYYPFARCVDEGTLKRAILLYDHLMFVDPKTPKVRAGLYSVSNHQPYLPWNAAQQLAEEWQQIENRYDLLFKEGLVSFFNPSHLLEKSTVDELITGLPAQHPSPPSRPTCGPPRRLLALPLQQQLDALSDEGRGVPVLRVGDQLPHPVPRRLIHAEGDDSRLSYHSLSSFPWGRDRPVQGDRRLNPIRPSTVLFNGPLGTTGRLDLD